MASAVIIKIPLEDRSIRLLDHLPKHFVNDAAALYITALADKLGPVYGSGIRAQRALSSGFNRHMCIVAMDNDRLVGILGIQTATAGFMDVTITSLRRFYGTFSGLWRMALLAFLHHSPVVDEAYIDGVAVAPAYRGRGIGSGLIAALEGWARERHLSMLCLEVVDTNPHAERLYRHLGFEAVREQTVWPVGTLFGFRSSTVMIKLLI